MNASPATAASRRPGLSLVEVVVCTLLVGVVLVSAMNAMGSLVRGRTNTADKARAQQMAQQLMAEIVTNQYHEAGLLGLGIELGESASNRSTFDDVDDYDGLIESPPENRSGTALANSTGWRQAVEVDFVDPGNPATVIGSNEGLKRVRVTVTRTGVVLARLVTLRCVEYAP